MDSARHQPLYLPSDQLLAEKPRQDLGREQAGCLLERQSRYPILTVGCFLPGELPNPRSLFGRRLARSNLRHSTVDDHLAPVHEAALAGCQESDHVRDLLVAACALEGGTEAAKPKKLLTWSCGSPDSVQAGVSMTPGLIAFTRMLRLDGGINGKRLRTLWPDAVTARGIEGLLDIDAIAEAYWQLHIQPRTAWTHQLDLRPLKESF